VNAFVIVKAEGWVVGQGDQAKRAHKL